MKINEVEQLLGITKANIRFYEKQRLLSPERKENGYREYSQEDIERIQTIVILRKLGISIEDIGKIFSGELSFQTAIQSNIADLEDQIRKLEGALSLSRQIAREREDVLDTQRYWEIIQQRETEGEGFVDIALDYWGLVLGPLVFRRFGITGNMSWKKILLRIALVCGAYSLMCALMWQDWDVVANFFHWPIVILGVALLTFPIFWLGKYCPKVASILSVVMFIVCVIIIAGVLLLLVICIINSIFNPAWRVA